jgi:hypothetical protein
MPDPIKKHAAYIDARARKHPQEAKIDVRVKKYDSGMSFGFEPQSKHTMYIDPNQSLATNLKKLKALAVKLGKEGHPAVHIFMQYTNGHGDYIQQEHSYFPRSGKAGKTVRVADSWDKVGRSNILFRTASGAPVTKKNLKTLNRSRK